MIGDHQITIKDIARELSIAPSTVSRALKDHPDISAATKKAVQDMAEKLDYQPNSIALSLRKSKSFIIGVIVPEIIHRFFSSVISGIEEVAYDEGYHVMICQSNEDMEREKKNTHALFMSRVDGFIVSVSKNTTNFDHLFNIAKRNIPLVFFDRVCTEIDTSTVVVEDFEGAYHATEHLIQQGCKRIAHLCGPDNLTISEDRKNGYIQALKDANIQVDESLIIKADTFEEGRETLGKMLETNPPDGLFTVNDSTAMGAIKSIKENGLSVPNDIAVVGFGDEPISQILDPELSSVYQPGYEMGKSAAKLFFEQLNNKEEKIIKHEVLKTKLIKRASSLR